MSAYYGRIIFVYKVVCALSGEKERWKTGRRERLLILYIHVCTLISAATGLNRRNERPQSKYLIVLPTHVIDIFSPMLHVVVSSDAPTVDQPPLSSSSGLPSGLETTPRPIGSSAGYDSENVWLCMCILYRKFGEVFNLVIWQIFSLRLELPRFSPENLRGGKNCSSVSKIYE